jgi:hypothetical protein
MREDILRPIWSYGKSVAARDLNDSRCAQVFNVKIGVFKQMLDLMESMSYSSDFFNEDMLDLMGEAQKKSASPKMTAVLEMKKPVSPAKKKQPGNAKPQPFR